MSEKVVTVGLKRPDQTPQQFNALMEELSRLVETAGGTIVHTYAQSLAHPVPATLLGKGKIESIAAEIKNLKTKTVVFDDNLTATQQKNIEKICQAKIIDRTRLILDIFSRRARTKEGQLQVELAQLNYLVPRLTGAWRGFSQQTGGIGTRGPGERKIEVERRYVRERIKRLKTEIEDIRRHRGHIRQSRSAVPLPQIALVGYTNVGKSTLLNSLVGNASEVYADDKLFATLDPTTRRIKLPGGRMVLFTDTVGFIQKLPTSLVAAFRATLEEIKEAALLVHVVDASAPDFEDQELTVKNVIKDLEADHIPILKIFNKADLLTNRQCEKFSSNGHLLLSGKNADGITNFLEKIEQLLDTSLLEVSFLLPHHKRNLLPDIYQTGYIIAESSTGEGTNLKVKIDQKNWNRISTALKNGKAA